jgi:Ni/Co efflux regulator RcnB
MPQSLTPGWACLAHAAGGRDQFNWDNVKSDKDREFYLGHSVKASTGRWQKGARLPAEWAAGWTY